MKRHIIFFMLFIQIALNGQPISYKKGEVINELQVKNSVGETFALYLPTSFDAEVNSAIIFIFDPSGTAINGINAFKEGAEKYGYILACSNNSKNGPYQINFDVTNRLFNHIFSEFNIAENRIYTAGFSGGSRLACTVAVLTGAVQGVIGCGAGFDLDPDKTPTFESKFSYVGLVGDEDMNFQEMHHVQDWLNRMNVKNALFTFEGDHRWPDALQIDRALSWLELQAYGKGIKPIDHDLIKNLYKRDYDIAIAFEKEEQIYQAANEFERIIKEYGHFIPIDSLKRNVSLLKASDPYTKELIKAKDIEAKEHTISENFLDKFRKESIIGKSDDDFNWWKTELKILNQENENNNDIALKKMYSRLGFRLSAMAYENSMIYRDANNWLQALYCDNLLVILYPIRPYLYFRLAQSYAQLNELGPTIQNLKKAITFGFTNIESINTSKEFTKFKGKKKFDEFLNSINN